MTKIKWILTSIILKTKGNVMKKEKEKKESKNNFVREKKEKSQGYKLKNNNMIRVMRVVFWIFLIWFFIRGLAISLRPDQTNEVNQVISDFKKEFSNYKDQDSELLSFAQNFVKEYMTYQDQDEEGYKQRIRKYVADNVYGNSDLSDLKGNAKVTYVKAYKKESYSTNQVDVYVLADITYTLKTLTKDTTTFEEKTKEEEVVLKVPIYISSSDNTYIVEDTPMFVNDSMKTKNYKSGEEYYASEINDDMQKKGIEKSLTIFLKAYYEQEQKVINYYLTEDADSKKFIGLDGRFKFNDISDLRCYQDENSNNIICILKIKVQDINEVTMLQEFNVILVRNNNKYYVEDMNTKIVKLNIKK